MSNNSMNPKKSNSTNTTSHAPEYNSAVRRPTRHITPEMTRAQSTASLTYTTLATQSVSELTTTVSTASKTVQSSVATVQGSDKSTSTSTPLYFTTETTFGNQTNNTTRGDGLSHSEMSFTILFSVILGVIVLIVLGQFVYKVTRRKHRRVQYSHRPLYNEDTGEQFMAPDDTMVISGGLYDGPQIYNSTVTALNEDQSTFAYTPTQLRLEFLEDPGTEHSYKASTLKPFNTAELRP